MLKRHRFSAAAAFSPASQGPRGRAQGVVQQQARLCGPAGHCRATERSCLRSFGHFKTDAALEWPCMDGRTLSLCLSVSLLCLGLGAGGLLSLSLSFGHSGRSNSLSLSLHTTRGAGQVSPSLLSGRDIAELFGEGGIDFGCLWLRRRFSMDSVNLGMISGLWGQKASFVRELISACHGKSCGFGSPHAGSPRSRSAARTVLKVGKGKCRMGLRIPELQATRRPHGPQHIHHPSIAM